MGKNVYVVMIDHSIKDGINRYIASSFLHGVYTSYKKAREIRDNFNEINYEPNKNSNYYHAYILARVLNAGTYEG